MVNMCKGKKIALITLCTIIFLSVSIYGFASDDKIKTDKPKAKVKMQKMEKIFDKDKDKLFENLSEKMNKAKDDEEISVIVVFEEKMNKVRNNDMKMLLGSYKIKHEYKNIPAVAMKLNKGQINKLSKLDIVNHIEYDEEVKAFNDTANYWFGTEKARNDFGLDGDRDGNINSYSKDDVVVAVIDTGIDGNHVDLDDGKIIGWKDYVNNQITPYDDQGHGTHVSGIIAGTGEGNSDYEGVAKGAALVGLKVLNNQGSGSMSDVTAAIDWCITNKDVYGIDIINMSLGTSGSSDGTDSTSLAVNNAVNNGIVVVVAAGNSGPSKYTIGSPGAADKAITVAAMADVGENGFNLTDFSSRGPTADGRIKPDIASPGYNITAPKANSSASYIVHSGTSMATPFTAGTIALMLDANPNLNPLQIKNTITSTAEDWGVNGNDIEYGYGRLDGYEAIKQAGGFSGSNIAVPNHMYGTDSLSASKKADIWEFTVNDTNYPIAITLVITNWQSSGWSSTPDFDVYLYDSNGNRLASSTGVARQENINFTPTSTGTYKIEVYSYSDSGNYLFDLSVGGNNLTLVQNQ
ncbi:S8 family serine peptidase [Paramaledivibacter caminithermalis]|uniref:Serine protease AprX n=1 Tax=Paramaledivibacter caminithermalis (strain DSM 15212 / CIP 107654 / DViRD3) TaxID=1121301 RepID=A0A1M6R337_PARC5|nr:S8 family serine peptidase [Paramaledivibacter caminithermalis]SHK26889.1 serine protease AprX [Paramaledivibacter caminithermalis DSM 15212]